MQTDIRTLPKLDLHTHSTFSDGHQTLQEIIYAAQRKELTAVAVTDHHTDTSLLDKYERMNDLAKIRDLKDRCRALGREAQTSFLLGVEADIVDLDGCLNVRSEITEEVDLVIASLHVIPGIEMRWERVASGDVGVDRREVAQRCMQAEIAALNNGQVDILGHPLYVLSAGHYVRSIDEIGRTLEELAETAAKNHIAVEVNGHFFRDFTAPAGYFALFTKCLESGAKLSTGTDAHQSAHVGELREIHTILSQLGAKPSDIYSPISHP